MRQHRVLGPSLVVVFAFAAIVVTACVPDPGPGSTTTTTTSSTTTTTDPSASPTIRAVRVTAGDAYSCAIMSDTTARCWGLNEWGQLGDGSQASALTPVTVSGLTNLTEIDAGRDTTCALRYDRTVWCWGYNHDWLVGVHSNNADDTELTPVQVPISGVTDISTGYGHVCALKSGTVFCWGLNGQHGGLGVPPDTVFPDYPDSAIGRTSIPQAVPGISTAVSISAGYYFTCAALANGSVKCWGSDVEGQATLGAGTTFAPPTLVPGIADVVEVSVGLKHTCGRRISGAAVCWGANTVGQLGNGLDLAPVPPRVATAATGPISAVDAGGYSTCGTLLDKTATCWGSSSGFPEDGFPHLIAGLAGVTDLGVGWYDHACAVVALGAIKCWGRNLEGQLGNGTTLGSTTPVDVSGIPFVAATPIDCSARGVGVDLHGCDLTGADLSGGNLSEANLSGADLTNAVLTNTVLTGANLAATTLTGAQGFGTGSIGGVTYTFNTVCPDGSTPKTNLLLHDYFGCYPS